MFDSLFRSKGLKFTFGCNAQIVERIGGEEYWKLLKDMQNYGHDIADHSPNHYSQFFEVTSMQDTLMYASKQGVDQATQRVRMAATTWRQKSHAIPVFA
jgi:peptidoglycan/xylan/chitin deacetylase (PgdA/CDA1 family)